MEALSLGEVLIHEERQTAYLGYHQGIMSGSQSSKGSMWTEAEARARLIWPVAFLRNEDSVSSLVAQISRTDQTGEGEESLNQGWGVESTEHWKPRDQRD